MKTKWQLITSVICILLLLSACSYKEFEDSMKSKLNKEEEEEYINPAIVPEASSKTESSESEERILYSIGDTIRFMYPNDGTVEYTLNQVNIVDNIDELELKKDDFVSNQRLYISDNGDISNNHRLLTLDVTVKNIDYRDYDDDEYVDEYVDALNIEDRLGFKSDIEDPNGPFSFEAGYFSGHPILGRYPEDGYYFFPLEMEEEVDVTIGWFIPDMGSKGATLYYIIGSSGSSEDYEYFELTFE